MKKVATVVNENKNGIVYKVIIGNGKVTALKTSNGKTLMEYDWTGAFFNLESLIESCKGSGHERYEFYIVDEVVQSTTISDIKKALKGCKQNNIRVSFYPADDMEKDFFGIEVPTYFVSVSTYNFETHEDVIIDALETSNEKLAEKRCTQIIASLKNAGYKVNV